MLEISIRKNPLVILSMAGIEPGSFGIPQDHERSSVAMETYIAKYNADYNLGYRGR